MKLNCYCVYDSKALLYHTPFYASTDAAAVRTLSDAVGDPQHMIGRHPRDYVLYCVGTFDDSKGAMEPISPLRHVIDAVALVKSLQSEIPFPEHITTTRPAKVEEEHQRMRANGWEPQ